MVRDNTRSCSWNLFLIIRHLYYDLEHIKLRLITGPCKYVQLHVSFQLVIRKYYFNSFRANWKEQEFLEEEKKQLWSGTVKSKHTR